MTSVGLTASSTKIRLDVGWPSDAFPSADFPDNRSLESRTFLR